MGGRSGGLLKLPELSEDFRALLGRKPGEFCEYLRFAHE